MQKTIYNQQEPFVYLWRDRLSNRYYIGYHCGKNPNYICSSRPMMEQYRQRPEDFTRRILATGTQEEMSELEQRLLHTRKKHLGERYYNLAISWPIFKWTDDMRKARSILHKGRIVSDETRRKMAEATRKRWANMTAKQKKQRSDRIKAHPSGGRPVGTGGNKRPRPINFVRKVYDRQRKITLRNQDFLLFGL